MSIHVKTCRICLKDFPLDSFTKGKNRNGSERIRNECKICKRNIEKERRANHRDEFIARDKRYYEKNKEVILEKNRQYRNNRKLTKPKEEQPAVKPRKDKKAAHPPVAKPRKDNEAAPPRKPCRSAAYRITSAAKTRTMCALKDLKPFQVFELIGCSKKEFLKWLSFQFYGDQTLENFGALWHMDHVIPVSFFNLSDCREAEMCFHWTNIRPLYSKDNHKKASKIIKTDILKHMDVIKRFCQDNKGYQTDAEKCWWPRVELGYGKNPKDEEDFESFLKWTIRS